MSNDIGYKEIEQFVISQMLQGNRDIRQRGVKWLLGELGDTPPNNESDEESESEEESNNPITDEENTSDPIEVKIMIKGDGVMFSATSRDEAIRKLIETFDGFEWGV